MPKQFTSPSVVVGVDGSRNGVRAALWGAEEASARDLALRLVSVEESADSAAGPVLGDAVAAIEAAGVGARIETEVMGGSATEALLDASRGAAMVCVGAVGLKHFEHARVGSTATALVASAHCPVAVIRTSAHPRPEDTGWVVAELDETPDSAAVLAFAVEEARLRTAPLRVLGAWQSRYTDVHDSTAVADGNRLVRAQLDRRLSEWRHRYPDLDVRPVAVHGSMLHYLVRHAASIQLIVVGARNTGSVGNLLGPTGMTALHDTDCSVLVVDRQRLL